MELDWGCILDILSALEAKGDAHSELVPKQLKRWEPECASYHMALLAESGFIVASVLEKPRQPLYAVATRLTLSGHSLLEHMTAPDVWGRFAAEARKRALPLTLDLVKAGMGAFLEHLMREPARHA